ncbi:cleavage and polyadenylation specificity factor subunit 1 [Histomonas meleagridis]|uniref:cleavage and polyadenylation specificity factor subunit 1 n=1 Tax=Histomonas meleagridis TaxID=135588 RepID=UPI00355A4EAD|nr:cleavage and polyadenylation specificity factor subunit 1 [Histomonas meleagridis]KAH0799955.1 cleavage and polyadenylation specificity factor subunit 1 [Histomonas meleagridis]
MDTAYRTICDPPAFTTATKCILPFSQNECIAAASGSKLQIYTFDEEGFHLIWEKNFWANIFSVVRHRMGDYDILILGCDYSKVVALQAVGDIDLQETEFHRFDVCDTSTCLRYPPKMIIDPNDSCIALLLGGDQLLFLTLFDPNDFSKSERPILETGQHSGWNIITGAIHHNLLHDYDPPFFRTIDIRFLEGYNRPTLAIVHEPIPTFSVRLPIQKSTITVSLISPLLIRRRGEQSDLKKSSWNSRPIPHNFICIIPVFVPHGGFIVLTKNAILYMTHTSGFAYGLNSLAVIDDECPYEISDHCETPHEIYSSAYCVLDSNHILITVDQHVPAILTLHDNGIDITGMSLYVHEDFEFHPSLFLHYKDNLIFAASTIQDTYMLSLNYQTEDISNSYFNEFQLTESQKTLFQMLYKELPEPVSRHIITKMDITIVGVIYQIGTVTCSTPFINFDDTSITQGINNEAISMALGYMNIIEIDKKPFLIMLMREGNLIIYQIHYFGNYNFGFRKIKTRRFTSSGKTCKFGSIISFTNINGYSGAYICCEHPMYILSECGYPRIIPSPIGIYCTQYHQSLMLIDNNDIKLINFDNLTQKETHIIDGCIVQRIKVGQTIRSMTFAPSWRAIIFFSSYPILFTHENEPDIDPEASLTPHYQKPPTPPREFDSIDGLPLKYEEHYDLNIITSEGIIKALSLDNHEYGNCVSFIRTSENYQVPNSTLSEYLAIGTGYMCHEERLMRGRLAIYKGSIIQSDENNGNEYQLQELFSKVFLAPVNVITELDGYIAAFIGGQLQMLMFVNEKQYKVVSQLNGHFIPSQMLSLKNLLFYIDIYKGCQLIRWRNYGHKLITMAKDFLTFSPIAGALLTKKGVLATCLFDNFGNVQISDIDEYAIPIDAFVRKSIFYLGCRPLNSGFFPIKSAISNEIDGHFGWFVSDHGKFGILSPINNELDRRRLCLVQSLFEKTLTGFSHLEYRCGKFPLLENQELMIEQPRLVVDMDLMMDFLEAQPDLQKQCMKSIGRSSIDLIASINEIYGVSKIFE